MCIRDSHNGVAGLGGSQQVADRADAADARRDRGHLVIRPAFRELLEPAHLRHMKLRPLHVAVIVDMDGDPGVSLDAGNRCLLYTS